MRRLPFWKKGYFFQFLTIFWPIFRLLRKKRRGSHCKTDPGTKTGPNWKKGGLLQWAGLYFEKKGQKMQKLVLAEQKSLAPSICAEMAIGPDQFRGWGITNRLRPNCDFSTLTRGKRFFCCQDPLRNRFSLGASWIGGPKKGSYANLVRKKWQKLQKIAKNCKKCQKNGKNCNFWGLARDFPREPAGLGGIFT